MHCILPKNYYIVDLQNSLDEDVVNAVTPNSFNSRLDKNWLKLPIKFNYTSHLTNGARRNGCVNTRSEHIGKSPPSSIYVYVYVLCLNKVIMFMIS